MSDAREKLKATIDELHGELDEMDTVDAEIESLLKSAVNDIHGVLDKHEKGEASEGVSSTGSAIWASNTALSVHLVLRDAQLLTKVKQWITVTAAQVIHNRIWMAAKILLKTVSTNSSLPTTMRSLKT